MNTEQQLIEKWRNLLLDKQQQVLKFVESLQEQKSEVQQRPFGLCQGEFVVPDDFNEPLPDEILDLFDNFCLLPSASCLDRRESFRAAFCLLPFIN